MKKIYKIKVAGKVYEVELQEVTEVSGEIENNNLKKESNNSVTNSKESTANINAPMNGTIVDIKVAIGDLVKKGDVVAILEAMKMETEIISPSNGTVSKISANKGDQVSLNNTILTIN